MSLHTINKQGNQAITQFNSLTPTPINSFCLKPIGLFLTLLFSGFGVAAQLSPPAFAFDIPHSTQTPKIDGIFTAAEWQEASHVELTLEVEPGQNIPALVATTVYLMEDGENLLVAFVAEDPDPSKIRAYYRDRDSAYDDDFVGIIIDTFNNERSAFEFFVNPFGVQMDLLKDDVNGIEDPSWNAIWDSAGTVTASGFVTEMKIPLKQLRFAQDLDVQTWGIALLRSYPRDVRHQLSNFSVDYGKSCFLCQMPKTQGFSNLTQSANLQIIPAMTSLWSENRPNPATDPWQRNSPEFDGGVDVRWGINQDMILNVTFNPDFSQVEADNAQLDINNTFSLSFPERREFFLDGADYFNTEQDLVHTRNINDPDYGAKLTGKYNQHSYGVLFANDTNTSFLIPSSLRSSTATLRNIKSENLALRYRYDLGRNITLGALGTVRTADNYHNTMLSLDGNWRVTDSDSLQGQILQSDTAYPLQIQTNYKQAATLSDSSYWLNYEHEGEYWNWELAYEDTGEDFRADLGFINQVNYTERSAELGRTWRPQQGRLFNKINVYSEWELDHDQRGLALEENFEIGAELNGPLQSYLNFNTIMGQRFFDGRYFDEKMYGVHGQFSPWGGAQFSINLNTGQTIDFSNVQNADVFNFSPGFTLQLGKHLETRLSYFHQELSVDAGKLYTTDLSDLRITYQFSNRSFVRAILVYSTTERNRALYKRKIDAQAKELSTQLLFSYKLNVQTRFFIGYSDAAEQGDLFPALAATNHTIFAKFSYAWQY